MEVNPAGVVAWNSQDDCRKSSSSCASRDACATFCRPWWSTTSCIEKLTHPYWNRVVPGSLTRPEDYHLTTKSQAQKSPVYCTPTRAKGKTWYQVSLKKAGSVVSRRNSSETDAGLCAPTAKMGLARGRGFPFARHITANFL